MLNIIEIKKAIVLRLKTLDIDVFSNNIKSGFQKPAFFVQIKQVNEDSNYKMSLNTISVWIYYFSKEQTDLDNIKVLNKLKNLFRTYIPVKNRNLTLYDKEHDLDDNVLIFKFNLKFTDEYEEEEYNELDNFGGLKIEKMKELNINLGG